MQRLKPTLLLAALIVGGCATAPENSVLLLGEPQSLTRDGLTVSVDPFVESERQEAFFSARFQDQGVFVARVVVRNGGAGPVEIRPSEITLALAGAREMRGEEGSQVAGLVLSRPNTGAIVAGAIVAGVLVGYGAGSSVADQAMAADQQRQTLITEYDRKELKDDTIEAGSSFSGFLYFVHPSPNESFDRAVLRVPVGQDGETPRSIWLFPLGKRAKETAQPEIVDAGSVVTRRSEPPYRTTATLRAYVINRKQDIARQLKAYSKKHTIDANASGARNVQRVNNIDIVDAYGDMVWLEIGYQVGNAKGSVSRFDLFKLKWEGDGLSLVGHQEVGTPPENPPTSADSEPAAALLVPPTNGSAEVAVRPDPAIYADWQLNGYLAYHAERFRSRLTDYNAKEKLAIDARGSASVRTIFKTRLVETKDKRVVMDIGFNVGTPPNMEVVEHTFDLEWRDGHLEVVGHRG